MNRRHYLRTLFHALPVMAAPSLRAEILAGQSAKMHGQRSREVWQATNHLTGVRLAKPGQQIQAAFFIDLNCPACARFWRWFDTPARRQWATLWIPVAYMNAQSLGRAASLLRAADPYRALALNYRDFDDVNRQGKLAEGASPSPEEQTRIRTNTRYWNGALFPTTPLSVYRNHDGTYWQLLGLFPDKEMNQYFSRLAPARLEVYTGP
jgi:hypothetical protein